MIDITSRHLGDESVCLNDIGLLRAKKSQDISTWRVFSDKLGFISLARMAKVSLRGKREAYADLATGQLYCVKTLRCMSGPLSITRDDHDPKQ